MASIIYSDFYKARLAMPFRITSNDQKPSGAPSFYGLSPFDDTFERPILNNYIVDGSTWAASGLKFILKSEVDNDVNGGFTTPYYKCQFLRTINFATDEDTYDFEYSVILSSTDSVNDQILGGINLSTYNSQHGGWRSCAKVIFDNDIVLPAAGYVIANLRFSCNGVDAYSTPYNESQDSGN